MAGVTARASHSGSLHLYNAAIDRPKPVTKRRGRREHTMEEQQKIPLSVAWLSEEGWLTKAGKVLGYYDFHKPSDKGIHACFKGDPVNTTNGRRHEEKTIFLEWEFHFMFTIAQLIEMNCFELGSIKYCPHCKKLQVDCDREQQDIWDHNHGDSYPETQCEVWFRGNNHPEKPAFPNSVVPKE